MGAPDAVIVGWSLGGHIALEAAPAMPAAAGHAPHQEALGAFTDLLEQFLA